MVGFWEYFKSIVDRMWSGKKKKRWVKEEFIIFILSDWRNGIIINRDKEEERRVSFGGKIRVLFLDVCSFKCFLNILEK